MPSEAVAGEPGTWKLDHGSHILVLNLISGSFLFVCLVHILNSLHHPPAIGYFYIKRRFCSLFSWCFLMRKKKKKNAFVEKILIRSKETSFQKKMSEIANSSLWQEIYSALVLSCFCADKGSFIDNSRAFSQSRI